MRGEERRVRRKGREECGILRRKENGKERKSKKIEGKGDKEEKCDGNGDEEEAKTGGKWNRWKRRWCGRGSRGKS